MIEKLGELATKIAIFFNLDAVKKWLKAFVSALKNMFITLFKNVAHASATFMRELKDKNWAATIYKLYYKENRQYVEEVRTRIIPRSALPSWVKKKLDNSYGAEVATDEDFKKQEQLTLTI